MCFTSRLSLASDQKVLLSSSSVLCEALQYSCRRTLTSLRLEFHLKKYLFAIFNVVNSALCGQRRCTMALWLVAPSRGFFSLKFLIKRGMMYLKGTIQRISKCRKVPKSGYVIAIEHKKQYPTVFSPDVFIIT